MLCDIAHNLSAEDLRRIQTLENALGLTIVAFSCRAMDPQREERMRKISEELSLTPHVAPAVPDDQQLRQIQEAEKVLGVALVAVQPDAGT